MKSKFLLTIAIGLVSTNLYANAAVTVRADTKTHDMKVKLQEDGSFKIRSWHEVFIQNNSNQNARFHYIFNLCAENKGCGKPYENDIEVAKNSEKRFSYTMERKIAYGKTGRREYSAKTDIFGIVNDSRESRSNIYVYVP